MEQFIKDYAIYYSVFGAILIILSVVSIRRSTMRINGWKEMPDWSPGTFAYDISILIVIVYLVFSMLFFIMEKEILAFYMMTGLVISNIIIALILAASETKDNRFTEMEVKNGISTK